MHNQLYYRDLDLEDRLKFVKGLLKMYNSEQKELNFHYDKELQHLDISNNKNLNWAAALQNFPLKSLDTSHTKFYALNSLKQVELQELNASHTEISRLKYLLVSNLRSLDISHTNVSQIYELKVSPVQVLNISHTRIDNLDALKHMKYLRNLIVHRGQFSKTELAKIPEKVELQIVD